MINYLANPQRFLEFEKYASPVFAILTVLLLIPGLWFALFASPADYQQGESVRILYIHVPAAWSALMAYTALTVASFVSFVWRHNLADSAAKAFATCGAAFTFLTLITGSLWGQPTWGTWWQWDGRMTSVLVLLFIYIGYLLLWQMIDDRKRAARLAAILAMVGFINIPIIKFSVEWWNTLHQPATLSNIGAPGAPAEILIPWMFMAATYTCLFGWLSLKFIRADIRAMQAKRRRTSPRAKAVLETL